MVAAFCKRGYMQKKRRLCAWLLALSLGIFGLSACEMTLTLKTEGGSSVEDSESVPDNSIELEAPPEDIVTADLSIHFLYLGNIVSGDSTLIKVGDTEVLIDAGSRRGSADTIIPYIRQYCTDGVLEYVVATHAHEDHISAFVGDPTENVQGVFDAFECETIIDYTGRKTNSQISKDYEAKRDAEVAAGAVHYTALDCWNNANGASRSYELGEGITLNILYQKYYEQTTSTENNYSVCTMISNGEEHYLFTGDLESDGEDSLVESNALPQCVLYKGGHHGSKTSSSIKLLNAVRPQIICVCSCCGDQHGFIHQEFIDNIAPYTDKVYVTTYRAANATPMPLNGNIVVTSEEGSIAVTCSNNDLLLKDSEWFKANRTLPEAWQKTDGA